MEIPRKNGFTLVELLISIAILTLLLVMISVMVKQTGAMWSNTRAKIEQFRGARDGFESMAQRISQATLNTYWDYEDANGNFRTSSTSFVPARYARQSELRFICGPSSVLINDGGVHPTHSIFFQAPLGVVGDASGNYSELAGLLNTCGYCIQYGSDADSYPPFIKAPAKKRFRLIELTQPSEEMTLYTYTIGAAAYNGKEWYTDALNAKTPPVHVLAENIIALILLPKLAQDEDITGTKLAPAYLYDSTTESADPTINPKNQLPPMIQAIMIAIDETSAMHMTESDVQALQTELSSRFSNASSLDKELRQTFSGDNSLEDYLIRKKMNYRIFTTNISIKGAKWSQGQKN